MPLSDIFAAVRWWAALTLLGAAAVPLAAVIFSRLADRGYAFTKMLGLLITGYLFWLLTSLGFLGNNLGGILAALLGLLALSAWALRQIGVGEIVEWLRDNRRQLLLTELVFGLAFALWVWVRAQNPAIAATEKPMEFAFLNAVGRSPAFPPLDPWLSGYAISYYYFGYVMTSLVARLAAVSEPVAFNLAIAWLLAGTAVGAFGLVYNLVAADGRFRRRARTLALIAALAIPIAGNLEVVTEVLYANGVGAGTGFWTWLDVRDINADAPPETPRYERTDWWWWRASRVINEQHLSGRAEEGLAPIAEFPGFSFVLGDMHPHVLSLPFAFLSLALGFAWWRRPLTIDAVAWRRGGPIDGSLLMLRRIGAPLLLFTALVLGGLSFLNTWDVLIHLFIVLGAFVLSQWREHGRWQGAFLAQAAVLAVVLAVPGVLLYLPFYLGFSSQTGPPFLLPMLMQPTRLPHFLLIFGLPLLSILILTVVLAARQRFRYWRTLVGTAVGLIAVLLLLMAGLGLAVAASADGAPRVLGVADEVGLSLPPLLVDTPFLGRLGWGLTAVARLLPVVLAARLASPGVILLLAGLAGLAVMLLAGHLNRDDDNRRETAVEPALPFILLLVLTGALLTLGPEFVYLRDHFGVRLNTVFKFYYQAWVMFGVAAVVGLDVLLRRARAAGLATTAVYSLLLAASLLFPILAVQSRAGEYRGMVGAQPDQTVTTLDGLAFVRANNPGEYEALMWLRELPGAPVVVEAVGGQYTGYGRVSSATGLPTLLGWAGHEHQWRGYDMPEPARRDPAVQTIYQPGDWPETARLLDAYSVDLIYVGPLELGSFGAAVREKFDPRLEVAFQNNSVTIYRWLPDGKEGIANLP